MLHEASFLMKLATQQKLHCPALQVVFLKALSNIIFPFRWFWFLHCRLRDKLLRVTR